jgi:biopolymer transport protein ExbD
MAKVKISKKSTRIDMTAMCDVAFLLLSFFIMSSTAKQPEPKAVDVPASTVIEKLPEEGVAVITVGQEQVYFTIPREIRRATLENMVKARGGNVTFTEEEIKRFESMDGFGVPFNQLKSLLAIEHAADRNVPGLQKGIPYDSVNNQLGEWVQQARYANRKYLFDKEDEQKAKAADAKAGDKEDVKLKDLDIAIKGDAKENFTTVQKVIDILQDQKKNKFFLVTNLRGADY